MTKERNKKLELLVEDLKHEIRKLECEKGQLEGTREYEIEQAKIEAYKEFWEVLKVRAKERVDYYTPQGCDHYFSNGTLCGYTAMLEAGEKLLAELKTGTIVIVKKGGVQE